MPVITAHVPLLDGVFDIEFGDGTITALKPSEERTDLCAGPTLFDLQVNGYAGRTCRIASPDKRDALAWITRLMHERGIGWWMPTITTASARELEQAFAWCGQALDEDPETAASIPGLHLEGPYISPVDGPRGAHRRAALGHRQGWPRPKGGGRDKPPGRARSRSDSIMPR